MSEGGETLSKASFRYVPGLDGLRAVAVLMVIAMHANVPFLRGGFVGVDVFFFISGYLITSLLIKEHLSTGRFNLKYFYARRSLRLFPALIVLLIVFITYSWLFVPADVHRGNLIDALVTLFYSQNWVWAHGLKTPGMLAHTWSLSIEEQFYVIWPLMLFLLLKICRSTRVLLFVIALFAVSTFAAMALLFDRLGWIYVYLSTETRAGSLWAGSLLGASLQMTDGKWLDQISSILRPLVVFGVLSIALIGYWGSPDNAAMYYYGFFVVTLASTSLVLTLATAPGGLLTRMLEARWLRWIGRLSYSLYIWHFPVLVFLATREMGWQLDFLIGISLSFLLASASYYLVELPFLRLKKRFQIVKV